MERLDSEGNATTYIEEQRSAADHLRYRIQISARDYVANPEHTDAIMEHLRAIAAHVAAMTAPPPIEGTAEEVEERKELTA